MEWRPQQPAATMNNLSCKKKCFCCITGLVLLSLSYLLMKSSTSSKETKQFHRFKLLAKSTSQTKHSRLEEKTPSRSFDIPHDNSNRKQVFPQIHARTSSLVDELSDILKYKISSAGSVERELKPVCQSQTEIANSCDGSCLRTSFSLDPKHRISELVNIHSQIPSRVEDALTGMAQTVAGNVDFMILSAASSNHFMEIQAFLHNVHENVYPHFDNFTLVVYNIGLTAEERSQVVKFCRCQVVDFPFEKFPDFVRKNRCYSWKPIIIKAHINQASVVVWADSSIRFDPDPGKLVSLLKRSRKRGIQLGNSRVVSPFRTFRSMYHYFGDEPCMYLNMYQLQATVGFYNREFFVDKAILEPWVSCAVEKNCMCPIKKPKKSCEESDKMMDAWEKTQGPIVYGLCHRFDQSAISLILHKLYLQNLNWVTFHVQSFMEIRRLERMAYFESLSGAV